VLALRCKYERCVEALSVARVSTSPSGSVGEHNVRGVETKCVPRLIEARCSDRVEDQGAEEAFMGRTPRENDQVSLEAVSRRSRLSF